MIVEVHVDGTHTGDIEGIPANGNPIDVDSIGVFFFDDGDIILGEQVWADMLSLSPAVTGEARDRRDDERPEKRPTSRTDRGGNDGTFVGERATVDFDHNSEDAQTSRRCHPGDLRARCPVAYTEQPRRLLGAHGLRRFGRAMRDEETFSSWHAARAVDGFHYAGVNIPEAAYWQRADRAGPAGVEPHPAHPQPAVRAAEGRDAAKASSRVHDRCASTA